MRVHYLLPGLILLFFLSFVTGCQLTKSSSDESSNKHSEGLMVFVTRNAQQVRERALSYGFNVEILEKDSAALQLVQALLNSPSDEFFAIINPLQKRYIAGGAVSDKVDMAEIDNLFARLKQVNKAGIQQTGRLYPQKDGHVRMLVFSDFQCPYCKKVEKDIEKWEIEYGDKLEVELVHFPLPGHEYAFAAAEASECARAEGKFEPYKEELFGKQETLSKEIFGQIARDLNLDRKKFSACMDLHQERKKVRQDQYFGQYLGLSGTPTLALNGEILFGLSSEEIKVKLDEVLKNKGTSE